MSRTVLPLRIGVATMCLALATGCEVSTSTNTGNGDSGGSGVKTYAISDIGTPVGDYMPPLDGGNLEIAAPQGWTWGRPGGDYLTGFHPDGSTMNNLPRILVAVEPSPLPGVSTVAESQLDQLVDAVNTSLEGQELKAPVEPVVFGQNVCVRYGQLARRKNAIVARQIIKTVGGGRLYTVTLESYDRQFATNRPAAYAVAAGMKFPQAADTGPVEPAEGGEIDGDDAEAVGSDTDSAVDSDEADTGVEPDSGDEETGAGGG
jgi:hypothetical protein